MTGTSTSTPKRTHKELAMMKLSIGPKKEFLIFFGFISMIIPVNGAKRKPKN